MITHNLTINAVDFELIFKNNNYETYEHDQTFENKRTSKISRLYVPCALYRWLHLTRLLYL